MLEQKLCGFCGSSFTPINKTQRYCGTSEKKESCAGKFRRERHTLTNYIAKELKRRRTGSDRTNWEANGRKRKRLAVIKRDGYSCQKCGLKNELASFFDVDHKDGNNQNHTLLNLWTLCPNCHRIKTIENGENLAKRYRNTTV